jgi:hypothetical protein
VELRTYPDQVAVDVTVPHENVTAWCLDLSLLLFEEIDLIHVKPRTAFGISIRCDTTLPGNTRGRVVWKGDDLEISTTQVELEYWVAFFLRYYRDGAAEVPDLQFEVDRRRTNNQKDLLLAFAFERVKPAKRVDDLMAELFPEEDGVPEAREKG